MKLTNEEIKQLKEQGKMIEEYIRENIIPFAEQEIEVDFGETVIRGRGYNQKVEKRYTLYVERRDVFGTCGGLVLYFDLPEQYRTSKPCGIIDIYNDNSYGNEFLYYLCLDWKYIKTKLLNSIKLNQKEKSSVFQNFEV